MQDPAPTPTELVQRLLSKECRQRSVLVFRGTGVNAWHHYAFLKRFTLAELSDFAAIYGISGGAAIVWFYVLAQTGLFDDAVGLDFDRVIRGTMNQRGPLTRLARIARRRFPYTAEDVERFLSALPDPRALGQTFAALALANFSVVAHDKRKDGLLVIDARSHPQARVINVLALAGTPRSSTLLPSSQTSPEVISDFDFAPAGVKRAFQHQLEVRHPGLHVYQINLLREGVDDQTVFVKSCADRFPRWSQALDLVLLLASLPNPHYRSTFERAS